MHNFNQDLLPPLAGSQGLHIRLPEHGWMGGWDGGLHTRINFSIAASLGLECCWLLAVCVWIERVHCILCDATLQVKCKQPATITICQDYYPGLRTYKDIVGVGTRSWGGCLVPCVVCISAACFVCNHCMCEPEAQSHILRDGE